MEAKFDLSEFSRDDQRSTLVTQRMPRFSLDLIDVASLARPLAASFPVRARHSGPEADSVFDWFALAVVDEEIHGEFREEGLVPRVQELVRQLNGLPIPWAGSTWIRGLWLELDELCVREGWTLRDPRKIEVRTPHGSIAAPFSPMSHPPTAIAEITFVAPASELRASQLFVNTGIRVIRLYKACSAIAVMTDVRPIRGFCFIGSSFGGMHHAAIYESTLTEADRLPIARFAEAVWDSCYLVESTLHGPNGNIAMERYDESLTTIGGWESRIARAIMCLEAIFLKGDERAELNRRLAQRVASLLRELGAPALEVQEAVEFAYRIRSKFLHGSRGRVSKVV